jgi:flagellar hook-associated protein 2
MASISSSTNTSSTSSLTAKTGIGGLVSGMDIDSLVEQLSATSRNRITKQQQNLQKLEWRQTLYRSVTTKLKEFQSKYLDVLSSTNFRSASMFNTVKAASSSSAVTVAATASSLEGSITIDSITKLATSASVKSTAAVTKPLTGSVALTDIVTGIQDGTGLKAGDSFSFNLDGTVRAITLTEDLINSIKAADPGAAPALLGDGLQSLANKAFGAGMVSVSTTGDKLTFTAENSRLTLYSVGGNTAVLDEMGFTAGQSNKLNIYTGSGTVPFYGTVAFEDIISGIRNETGIKAGDSFSINLDGEVKTVTFDEAFIDAIKATDPEKPDTAALVLRNRLQGLVDSEFGTGKIAVSATGSNLTFTAEGSRMILGTESDTLADLGFTAEQTNRPSNHSAIDDLPLSTALTPNSDGELKFTINGVDFVAKATDTIGSVMSKINSSKAGVNISYSSISDQFTMTAANSGAGDTLVFSDNDGGNFLAALGLTQSNVSAGTNAELTVDGQLISRSSNTFEIDGVKVTLNDESDTPINLSMTSDTTALADTIKKFVEDYNTMIDYVNGLVKENYDDDYQPLTDAQKDEMSETEITAWEKKAKTGLMRGDGVLKSLSTKIHTIMTGLSVSGTSLYALGITSAGYSENGKLKIDETKLKEALETKASEIKELFTSENGIANKLNEVITGAVKTSGAKGSRGTLIELAGYESTSSATENSIYEQMKKLTKNITTLQNKLTDEEARLWSKFTAMETAINNLNAQSAMLTSFTSQ